MLSPFECGLDTIILKERGLYFIEDASVRHKEPPINLINAAYKRRLAIVSHPKNPDIDHTVH